MATKAKTKIKKETRHEECSIEGYMITSKEVDTALLELMIMVLVTHPDGFERINRICELAQEQADVSENQTVH